MIFHPDPSVGIEDHVTTSALGNMSIFVQYSRALSWNSTSSTVLSLILVNCIANTGPMTQQA